MDSINALRSELNAGIPVVQVKRTRTPKALPDYPRPEHIQQASQEADVVVMRPRDLAGKMIGKKVSA